MIKFPSIPSVHDYDMSRLRGENVVCTEKLDGLNVALYNGQTYTRDKSGLPHDAGYMAMVKKHHAYQTSHNDQFIYYGEDLYAHHSCQYDPIPEDQTFRLFMILDIVAKNFLDWHETIHHARLLGFPTVPIIFQRTVNDVSGMLNSAYAHISKSDNSRIGGQLEGVVIRNSGTIAMNSLSEEVFKIVRAGHVQPDAEHWRRHWKPRDIIWETDNV